MWDLIEKPDTSTAAQVISVLSTIFVAVSIVGMTISTLPVLQYKVDSCFLHSNSSRVSELISANFEWYLHVMLKDVQGNAIDNPSLAMVETVCIAWFTLEYFIRCVLSFKMFFNIKQYFRLAGAPEKWAFLKDGMNIVDVLAIMPFFVSLFFMGPTTKM